MKIYRMDLDGDLRAAGSEAFFVLEVEHEHGAVYLSAGPGFVGADEMLAAVTAWSRVEPGGAEIACAADALPVWVEWWSGRAARIWEVPPGAAALYDGAVVTEGEIAGQPETEGGGATLMIEPPRVRPVMVPDTAPVDASAWPDATDDALGAVPPEIWGTVQNAPLLGVQVPTHTTLAEDVQPGDTVLPVDDASAFPASGTVIMDGESYSYTSRDDTTLANVSVAAWHRGGSSVAVSGAAKWLAAGHAVNSITSVKADGSILRGGTVDTSAATVEFSALPTRAVYESAEVLTAQFDEVDGTSTAVNGINAIQAATGTETQSASILPSGVTEEGEIVFARPAEQGGTNRIIAGVYTVGFTVSETLPDSARAVVRIGGRIAWVWDGGSVVWDGSPLTFDRDEDSDRVDVVVELTGAPAGTVSVTVDSASRTVSVGNLDAAAVAILRKSSETDLVVDQTTAMTSRGRIKRAWLLVEHATAASTVDTVDVEWAGTTIGQLSLENAAGDQSVTKTVEVDTVSSLQAFLQTRNVGNIFSDPASYASSTETTFVSQQPSYKVENGSNGTKYRPVSQLIQLPPDVTAQTLTVYVKTGAAGGTTSTGNSTVCVGGQCFSPGFNTTQSLSVSISAGQAGILVTHKDVFGDGPSSAEPTIEDIQFYVQNNPQFGLSGGGFSGDPQTDTDTSDVQNFTPTARVDGQTGTGNLSFTFSSPRSVVNLFPLPIPYGTDWSRFTNKTAALRYVGSGTGDVLVARFELLIEYQPVVREPATNLTATVTGRSGNPADVLSSLAGRLGDVCEPLALRRIRRWADAVGYSYSRRVADRVDATALLNQAVAQISARQVDTRDGLRITRRLDFGRAVTELPESDMLKPPRIRWTDPEDAVTRADVRTGRGRITSLGIADSDRWALLAKRQTQRDASVEVVAEWINADSVAAIFAADWLRLNAPLRRELRADLPYSYAHLERGDLIEHDAVTYEITDAARDGAGFVALTATEIPTEI